MDAMKRFYLADAATAPAAAQPPMTDAEAEAEAQVGDCRPRPLTDGEAAAAAYRGLTGRDSDLTGAQLDELNRRGVAQLLAGLR